MAILQTLSCIYRHNQLPGIKNGFRKGAGFEQGKAEYHGVGCKGEYRAVQVVRDDHAVYKDGVNADAHHD